jgi:hypothetical protein
MTMNQKIQFIGLSTLFISSIAFAQVPVSGGPYELARAMRHIKELEEALHGTNLRVDTKQWTAIVQSWGEVCRLGAETAYTGQIPHGTRIEANYHCQSFKDAKLIETGEDGKYKFSAAALAMSWKEISATLSSVKMKW